MSSTYAAWAHTRTLRTGPIDCSRLEHCSFVAQARDKQREEELRDEQQKELRALASKHQGELDALASEWRHETKAMEGEHQQQRDAFFSKHTSSKRQHDHDAEVELKSVKEGQYRDIDKKKKGLHAHRIDEEKRFSQEHKAEYEQARLVWQREQAELDEAHARELTALEVDREAETQVHGGNHTQEQVALDALHLQKRSAFEEQQHAHKEAFLAGQAEKRKALLASHAEAEKEHVSKLEEGKKRLVASQKHEKQAMSEAHVDERKALMVTQKEEIRRGKEQGEKRKTELAAKQEAERRDEFKRRQQTSLPSNLKV